MADDMASHVLGHALKQYISLTSEIPDNWDREVETLHYNRQRRLLSFMENLARDLSINDEEYENEIEEAENEYDPWGDFQDKHDYLAAREEALFKLLSRKNVLQLTRVQDVTDTDPLDPRDAWRDD